MDNDHNHPRDTEVIENARLRQHLVQVATDDPTLPARRIYHAAAAQQRRGGQGGGDVEVAPFQSVRSTIERARQQHLPPIPQTPANVRIENTWAETWNQARFLLELDQQNEIAIFATDENLNVLRDCTTIYMDGTFRACPRPYSQVFTIVGNLHGFVIPLVHVLMGNRRTRSYRLVFRLLKRAVHRITHHHWRPRQVVCDFEFALWAAVQFELPAARLGGCYFHWTQSLWRKVQEVGLARAYATNRQVRRIIRKVFALGYLPLPVVRLSFQQLLQAGSTQRAMNALPPLREFLEPYLRDRYVRANAPFPPADWNVYNRDIDQRTNNHVEGESFNVSVMYVACNHV